MLIVAGNADGAANRVYYAMFYAAKAALEVLDPKLTTVKSHASIIRSFGKRVVIAYGLDPSLGRAFNAAEDFRIAADYERKPIELSEAERLVDDMERFLTAVAKFLECGAP